MNKTFSAALATLLAAALIAPAWAQDKQVVKKIVSAPAMTGTHEGIPDLTDAQKDQMKKIRMEASKTMLPLQAQLEVKSAELKSLLISENPNIAAVNSKIDEIGSLRVQMQKKRVAQQLEIRKLLTPEQRLSFDERMLKGMERMEDGLRRVREMRIMRRGSGASDEPGMMENEEKIELE
jgi:Spy/CpxP family protein refolding chaperone